jgi:putative DNA primase/helicase
MNVQLQDRVKTFDIRNFTDFLTPAKGKNRYHCPVCEGNNLEIKPETGTYQCWNNCECKDIREALAPWDKRKPSRDKSYTPPQRIILKPQYSKFQPVPIPEDALIVRLPEKPTDSPQPQKPQFIPKRVKDLVSKAQVNLANSARAEDLGNGVVEYIPVEVSLISTVTQLTYTYSESQSVHRFDWTDASSAKGRGKTFMQCHKKDDGSISWTKGDAHWSAYKIQEAIGAATHAPNTPALLWVEGEKCVEIARSNRIASSTFQGSNWRPEEIKLALNKFKDLLSPVVMVFLHDPDKSGLKKAEIFKQCCNELGLPCALINPKQICDSLPHGAADIEEILAQINEEEFIRRLEQEIHAFRGRAEFDEIVSEQENTVDSIPDSFEPNTEITQKALEMLYGDKRWICANNKLYKWGTDHYIYSHDVTERARIANFCDKFPVEDKGEIRYPYANPATVHKILEWVKIRFGVLAELLNPPGINCTNGVLQIVWEDSVPSWKLIEHTPDLYYTYKPIAKYDPGADSTHCDRLLEVLDPEQREIFLRTIAASLDIPTVRKYKGRTVRALLLKGDGSNGKDSLREVVSLMYGRQGMTGCTLTDFAAYDEGRKFSLSKLFNSRVNWASENANTKRLDKIQSLKAFITGDILDSERKGIDSEEYMPEGIAIFNVNDTPDIQGTLEAIATRYGILSFNKTFKIKADPSKGEIEADPRFKYDPIFLATMVVPAFLNKVLQALVDLMREGIDYECTEAALSDIQIENCHLFQFCKDVGLGYNPDSTLTASEIWTLLEQWYQDNGTLDYEETKQGKFKAIWIEQAKKSDKNVKAANQVIPRFLQLFPKAKKVTVPHSSGKKTILAIQGIGFNFPTSPNDSTLSTTDTPTPTSTPSTSIPPQAPPQETLSNQDFHPSYPNCSNKNEKINQFLDNWTYNNVNTPKKSSIPEAPNCGKQGMQGEQGGQGGIHTNINSSTPSAPKQGWDECDAQSTRNSGVETGVETEVPATISGVRPPVIEKGTRVRIKPHTFGDRQDGQEGVVVRVKQFMHEGVKKNKYTVHLTNKTLPENMRSAECHAAWFDVLQ